PIAWRRWLALGVAGAGLACGSPASTVATAPSPGGPAAPAPGMPATPGTRRIPNDIRWFRTSAEYRALAVQAYRVATERLPDFSRGINPGAWAVILDADETVLDNSEYQRRRALADSGYSDPSCVGWVRERAALAVPGAVA